MATLWTEIMTPADMTGYARRSLEEIEAQKGSLAAYLPNRQVDDITIRFQRTRGGLVPTAEYRSFDAETTIGELPGGERVTLDLPPLGQKIRVGELDQLRARGTSSQVSQENIIASAMDRVVSAIENRLEAARGRVLETGKITIDENGFKIEHDLGRDESMTVTAATKWATGGNPIEDLQKWAEVYEDENGVPPGTILVSNKVRSALRKNETLRKMATSVNTPEMVSLDFINASLQAEGLPTLTVYNRRVNVAGKVSKILDEKKLFLLPAVGDNTLGATFIGTPLEASEPDYGIAAGDRAGIVAGLYKTQDPIATWVHAATVALPALINPNASMVATVLD